MGKDFRSGDLPVHPVTGLTALGIVGGRPVWPTLGGDETATRSIPAQLAAHDEQMQALRSEMTDLANLEAPTDEQLERFDAIDQTELPRMETEREPLARRAAAVERVVAQAAAGQGIERAGATAPSAAPAAPGAPAIGRSQNPFENIHDRVQRGSVEDMRTTARSIIADAGWGMSDTQRSALDAEVQEAENGYLARHLAMGSPAYARAFRSFIANRGQISLMSEDDQREMRFVADASRRSITEGGVAGNLIPPQWDPTIVDLSDETLNWARQVAEVVTTSTPSYSFPTMGNIVAGYAGENTPIGETTPPTGKDTILVGKLGAYVTITHEADEDTPIGRELPRLFNTAKENVEAVEFVRGDGLVVNGVQHIEGVLTGLLAAGGRTLNTQASGKVTKADIYALLGSLNRRYRRKFAYFAEFDSFLAIRNFADGLTMGNGWWAFMGDDTPDKLVGRSTYETAGLDPLAVDGTAASGKSVMIGGDLREAYRIVDRRGLTLRYIPEVMDPTTGNPLDKSGWYVTWRTGAAVKNANAAKVLKIKA